MAGSDCYFYSIIMPGAAVDMARFVFTMGRAEVLSIQKNAGNGGGGNAKKHTKYWKHTKKI